MSRRLIIYILYRDIQKRTNLRTWWLGGRVSEDARGCRFDSCRGINVCIICIYLFRVWVLWYSQLFAQLKDCIVVIEIILLWPILNKCIKSIQQNVFHEFVTTKTVRSIWIATRIHFIYQIINFPRKSHRMFFPETHVMTLVLYKEDESPIDVGRRKNTDVFYLVCTMK